MLTSNMCPTQEEKMLEPNTVTIILFQLIIGSLNMLKLKHVLTKSSFYQTHACDEKHHF